MAIMERGAVHNCFYVANETYKGSSESMDGVINAQNFNCICNGGISMTVLAEINKSSSAADLAAYLAKNNNIEKLGFLYDDTKDYISTAASFLTAKRAEKKSDLTLNETVNVIHFALFLCEIKDGAAIDDSVRKHSAGLDCSYADYTALADGIKTELANLLSKADYISAKRQVSLSEFSSVCKARLAATTWSSLKDLLMETPEEYSLNIGSGSSYSGVSVTNKQNVFYNMLSESPRIKNTYTDGTSSYASQNKIIPPSRCTILFYIPSVRQFCVA